METFPKKTAGGEFLFWESVVVFEQRNSKLDK